MIFLEYFRRHLNKTITVRLKSEIEITGILKNVDHFLNLQIVSAAVKPCTPLRDGVPQRSCPIQELEVCSIRGSAVKHVDLECNAELERRISDATLLRFGFDK